MKHFSSLLGAALLLAATATGAHAEGFGITEWSARGMSLAGGMVARADDPAAVAYNPAGITQLPGATMMLGSALSLPAGSIETRERGVTTTTDAKKDYWILPHFYATYQINDKLWFGAGIFTRFGLGNGFPGGWPGSAGMTDVAVHTVTINPNLAWKINEHISVAVGLEFSGGDLKMKQKLMNGTPYANRIKLSGQGGALGGNLALHLRFNDQWSAGVAYRSRMALNVHGKTEWTRQLGAVSPMFHVMQNSDLHGTMSLPDTLSFGLAWKALPNLSFEADAVYTAWSNYRHLDIYLENPVNQVNEQPKHWRDTWSFSGSVEYKPLDWLALRAGYTYETSPMNHANADYLVPSNGRQYFTFGTGFFWNNWTMDLAYTYIKVRDLNYDMAAANHPAALPGTATVLPGRSHNVHAHNLGIDLSYRF